MPVFFRIEDFYVDFHGVGRCIAVDYGTYKIGIAVGDFENKIAFPNNVLLGDWRQLSDVISVLFTEILKQMADVVVIGLPKSLDGTENEKCVVVKLIADSLLKKNNNLRIFLIDERFSTKATQSWRNFEDRKMKKKINKKTICEKGTKPDDASAASLLLDTFFEMTTNFCNRNDN